jgi:hypothetical protein
MCSEEKQLLPISAGPSPLQSSRQFLSNQPALLGLCYGQEHSSGPQSVSHLAPASANPSTKLNLPTMHSSCHARGEDRTGLLLKCPVQDHWLIQTRSKSLCCVWCLQGGPAFISPSEISQLNKFRGFPVYLPTYVTKSSYMYLILLILGGNLSRIIINVIVS